MTFIAKGTWVFPICDLIINQRRLLVKYTDFNDNLIMLNSITINNFKAIQSEKGLTLNNLASVNYLVGKNGCGKSSVLENIHLLEYRDRTDQVAILFNNNKNDFKDKYFVKFEKWSTLKNPTCKIPIILTKDTSLINDTYTYFLTYSHVGLLPENTISYNTSDAQRNFYNALNHEQGVSNAIRFCKTVKSKYFGFNKLEGQQMEFSLNYNYLEKENIDRDDSKSIASFVSNFNRAFNLGITYADENRFNLPDFSSIEINKLSGGQKHWVNLYLSLSSHCSKNTDSVVCLDEPEAGFHPELQRSLPTILQVLSEEYNIQFFVATHSPFIITSAIDLVQEDFGEFKCLPENEGKTAKELKSLFNPSQKVYKIEGGTCKNPEGSWGENAIFESSQLLGAGLNIRMPDKPVQNQSYIVYCEDESADNYNEIFRNKNCLFVACGSCTDVVKQFTYSKEFYKYQKGQIQIVGLVDNDPENPKTTDWQNIGIKVLTRREIENYLYDEVVIKSFDSSFDYTKASIINNVVDKMKSNKILCQKFRSKQLELSRIIREMGNEDQSSNNVYWQLHNLIFN